MTNRYMVKCGLDNPDILKPDGFDMIEAPSIKDAACMVAVRFAKREDKRDTTLHVHAYHENCPKHSTGVPLNVRYFAVVVPSE